MKDNQKTEIETVDLGRRKMLTKTAKYAALVPVSTLVAANAASAHSGAFGNLTECVNAFTGGQSAATNHCTNSGANGHSFPPG